MNNKKLILGLAILIFISISAVSAAENTTDIATQDDSPEMIAVDEDSSICTDNLLKVSQDDDNKLSNSHDESCLALSSDDADVLGASSYHDSSKSAVKLKAYKVSSKTNKYTTLKATVKDKWNSPVKQGTVKFIINGKSYKVNVKNGVATKKVKLTHAKTYRYKAIFSSKNYKTKTVTSQAVVKKVNNGHYIKKAGYIFRVTNSQYNTIQYVKNHKNLRYLSKYADFEVKLNKYRNGYPVYAIVTTWSGIRQGHYYHWPQVQFVVKYNSDGWGWDYLTGRLDL